ncbi:hypothetical protein D1AOALGA4SA_3698 [Olavius algarvensis Delta 1 endosymbiont]|nr:hypothetical protein D1AOALGA4SA_3698 [Olavius algarvensis Delta 1 endosymbiont]
MIIRILVKLVICSKITPKFHGVPIAYCHYRNLSKILYFNWISQWKERGRILIINYFTSNPL